MSDSSEHYLHEAMNTVAQSDPLIKLLQQVRLGRMQPTDAGLQAITDAWLSTYQQVVEKAEALDQQGLRRLDPAPRLEVLISAGVLTEEHSSVRSLLAAYGHALAKSGARA